MSLLEDFKWRYATKRMNGESVSQDKVDYILKAAHLAPTSSGLQPFRIFVISKSATKKQLSPMAMNQPQITECSHVLVFAAFDEYTQERVDRVFAQQERERNLPAGTTDAYKQQLQSSFNAQTKEDHFNHAARQAYIGLGFALAAAAEQRVDATPMEGFDNKQVDEFLQLANRGLRSVALLALGYRDAENDWLVNLKKVRTPIEEFII